MQSETAEPKPLRRRDPDRPWYSFAARLLPDGPLGRWADLGCGRGEFIEQASGDGKSGIGVDYATSSAKALRATGRPALVADLNRGLPFADQSLDGASLIEVIEHIVQAETLVAELARVIRPGGWLIVTTPNVVHIAYRWRALTGHPPKQEGYHYRFFTRDTLAQIFAEAGFRVTAQASFGKQALLSKLARIAGKGAKHKVRYVVPRPFEPLLAQHFVWRLERLPAR
ncbi:MAG TPA: class I SAM-dependent methyltransferase [Myxococcota bacterium]|nr:class I SAM-dependent methyltransferase [Myxococcota bacterium]